MDALVHYSIPIKGLRHGVHQFDYQIDRLFFQQFESSPIEEGKIELRLNFDKRPDMYVLLFEFRGTVRTECDRCLEEIDLPLAGSHQLLVKFSEQEEIEEAEVVYINADAPRLNVAKYIYEFIVLALPMIKVYDCRSEEQPVCNEEMLRYLNGNKEQEGSTGNNPVWDELKNLGKKN